MQTRKKSARRGLLVSATSLLLSVAMLVGTTFAWFTDSVSSGTNKIQAGNLDIELSHKTGSMESWEEVTNTVTLFQGQDGDNTQWEPGAVVYENFKIKNAGSLALKYVLDFKALGSGDFNTVVEANGEITNRSLKDVLYCAIQDETVTNVRPDMSKTEGKPLSEILNDPRDNEEGGDPYIQMSSLEPGAEKQLSIIVYWPRDLGNDIDNQYNLNNGKYASGEGTDAANPGKLFINLGLELDATQYEAENDSFGNDYDKNADGTNKYHGTVQSASVTGTTTNGTLTLTAPVAPATDNGSTQTTTVVIDGGLDDDKNYTLTTETSDAITSSNFEVQGVDGTPIAKIDLNLYDAQNNKAFTAGSETGIATITTYIAKGLGTKDNIHVVYSGPESQPTITVTDYDNATGKLVFTTTHFSEYYVVSDSAAAYIPETGTVFAKLVDAVKAVNNDGVIVLLKDETGSGIGTFRNATTDNGKTKDKGFTIDFNKHTYTVGNPAVGSTGTESQAFHFEWSGDANNNHKITLKNGKIDVGDNFVGKMVIQNYCDLTLEDMTVDGKNLQGTGCYVLSNNCGQVAIKGNTSILAKEDDFAFDVYAGFNGYPSVGVTVDTTGTIQGTVEFSYDPDATEVAKQAASLEVKNGIFTKEISVSNALGSLDISGATYIFDVSNNEMLKTALKQNLPNIVINLNADVTYDVTPWIHGNGTMGGDNTKSITINGNNHTLTFNNINKDWNGIYIKNEGAVLTIDNAKLTNSGLNDGPWNRHDINFHCKVVLNNVTSDKAIAVAKDSTLKNCTISDDRASDDYLLWIQACGETVSVENCTFSNTKTGGSTTRGIVIKDQYIDSPVSVTLNVSGTKFVTTKKAAVLVTNTAGANINWGEGNDISGVTADSTNAVWNDSDRTAAWDSVTVTGCTKVQE